MDNPAYGIYRCNAEGKILDVNEALINMLGYTTKEELLAASEATELLSNLGQAAQSAKQPRESCKLSPWKQNGNGKTARS